MSIFPTKSVEVWQLAKEHYWLLMPVRGLRLRCVDVGGCSWTLPGLLNEKNVGIDLLHSFVL